MDNRAEIREFLTTRRARITPERAGVPSGSSPRRVPGLRREEVAVLAGVSTDWYVRLEKGHIGGVSDDVLAAVARALRLDDAERTHLFDLARAARPSRAAPSAGAARRRSDSPVRPSIARIVESMPSTPAFVRNGLLDVLVINSLARALYWPLFSDPIVDDTRSAARDKAVPGPAATRAKLARFCLLDPRSHALYPDCAPRGRVMTSRCIRTGSRLSSTRSSATSKSASTRWYCPPTPA